MFPTARTEKLTIRELSGEVVVYDLDAHKLHCLNDLSAFVWKHCNSEPDVAALSAMVAARLRVSPEKAIAVTTLALEQLSRRRLLATESGSTNLFSFAERPSRRELLRGMAVLAALPLVMTLAAPTIAWAQGGSRACLSDSDCGANQTCVGAKVFGPHFSAITRGVCQDKPSAPAPCMTVGSPCVGGGTQGNCCAGLICGISGGVCI